MKITHSSQYKLTPCAKKLLARVEAKEELARTNREKAAVGSDPSSSDLRHWHLFFSSLCRRAPRLGLAEDRRNQHAGESPAMEFFQ